MFVIELSFYVCLVGSKSYLSRIITFLDYYVYELRLKILTTPKLYPSTAFYQNIQSK